MGYLVDLILFYSPPVKAGNIGGWCNGSTFDFGSDSIGSSPVPPTIFPYNYKLVRLIRQLPLLVKVGAFFLIGNYDRRIRHIKTASTSQESRWCCSYYSRYGRNPAGGKQGGLRGTEVAL